MVLPKMTCDECFNHADKESLAVDEELLVFGRELYQFAIWKYSLRSRLWVKCEGMHRPRWFFASGSLGGIAIVAGGTDMNGNILASTELYDSSSWRWEILPNIHSPPRLCSGFFMDGKLYVVGGMFVLNESVTWGRNLISRQESGGRSRYSTNMMKKYNKANNVMERLPPMVDSSNGWGLPFKPCGDQLLVFCGQRSLHEEGIVVNSWCPKSRANYGNLDWKVLGVKENVGVFVYNCAAMSC